MIESRLTEYDRRLLLLEYKSIYLDARGRRKNLVFVGFTEERGEDCKLKIQNFVRNKLEIQSEIVIDRAHRLGKYKRHSNRSIIVAFRDYSATEAILFGASKLKESRYAINRDFPKEIALAR